MSSTFGWLDQDDSQRAAMTEVIKLFQDESSVDELGIGPIRDSFSNTLFPGTSVLHTRVRYLLFIPWLVKDVARRGLPLDRARAELRSGEVRLIRALLAGGMKSGVIGSQAQDRLKTMPSQVYWPALQRFDIVTWDRSVQGHLRRAGSTVQTLRDLVEGDVDHGGPDLGIDPSLPPAPEAWLKECTFDLTSSEAAYLQEVFARLPGGSLLSWLAPRAHDATGDTVWEIPCAAELPQSLADRVDQARRLHHAWYGAPVLYNLMLAELADRDDLVDGFRVELETWESELQDSATFDGWDRTAFWSLVREQNPRLRGATHIFVERWFALVESGQHGSADAQRLLRERELRLKGKRARLQYAQARQTWTPGAGMGRLGYRWGVAKAFLADVAEGLQLAAPQPAEAVL
ncbi:DUF6361 family protein [Nocardioides sp. REDSEA-S30_B4]|uniref:DUF6361 family protein n=1 Tax=Nocardioides sp. REDSEA-S30_B4 TaxID=1811552 RepID=UPI000A98C9B2|nr:DUF6361 family protein [Nocardioides sp. REDSEA-S30_B4]